MRAAAGLLVLLLVACARAPVAAGTSSPPRLATSAATSTPVAELPPATPTPGAPATLASGSPCSEVPNNRGNLALTTLAGESQTVVRDVTDLSNPRTVCTLPAGPRAQFAGTATRISYVRSGDSITGPASIVVYDLLAGTTQVAVQLAASGFMSGLHAWSRDGTRLTYLDSDSAGVRWHLRQGQQDTVLATLPPVPGRGTNPNADSEYVGFSADGLYVAMVQTFTGSAPSADSAPFQVRRLDGTLAFSRSSGRWAVWAGQNRLYFTDGTSIRAWDPAAGDRQVAGGTWISPRASADGRRLAFADIDLQLPSLAVIDAETGAVAQLPVGPRDSPYFLNLNVLWYAGAKACDPSGPCFTAWQPSGTTYLYDLRGGGESVSRLATMQDVWPHFTTSV